MLLKAGIAATDAIRSVDPEARFVAVDPLFHTVPPKHQPERAQEAEEKNESQYEFWDMLIGQKEPELGGGTGYLDVVGVNYYPDTQTELDSDDQLPLDDPRRKPFREMLADVYNRYHRPIIVAETSARGQERPRFLRETVEECLAAMRQGVDLQGICLYPLVDMPEWKYGVVGPLGHLGLWDVVRQGEAQRRVINHAYLTELQEAQRKIQAERQPLNPHAGAGASASEMPPPVASVPWDGAEVNVNANGRGERKFPVEA
jgi:beta-glucosidase/6-phospho-beta-glucosidase/beta-galactosidase